MGIMDRMTSFSCTYAVLIDIQTHEPFHGLDHGTVHEIVFCFVLDCFGRPTPSQRHIEEGRPKGRLLQGSFLNPFLL